MSKSTYFISSISIVLLTIPIFLAFSTLIVSYARLTSLDSIESHLSKILLNVDSTSDKVNKSIDTKFKRIEDMFKDRETFINDRGR